VKKEKIGAHKIVLLLADIEFSSILSTENKNQEIVLNDFKPQYFQRLIKYCYDKELSPVSISIKIEE
jgi:hypothetical protein